MVRVAHRHREDEILCPVRGVHCVGSCVYADIMEQIDFGIIVLDTKKEQLTFQNKAATNIFGAAKGPIDYRTLHTLFLQGMGKGLIADGFGKPQTLHYKDKLLSYTAYVISDVYIAILTRDITERARLESIAEAFNTMENITYIFSGIRHELGNPVNSIKMTMSVLKKNLDRYPKETVLKYVDRTLTEISRVEYLLQSLKSFSMFEDPVIQNVDLIDFMDIFLSLVADDLEKGGIELEALLSPEAKWIRADPRALQQVMLNLIANASDALEGRDDPAIVISTLKKDGLIWINIEDNGCGISDDEQKNLFRPFYTTKPHGTGLGLVIARRMLVKMNSRIGVVSRKDVGTTATISIPVGEIEESQELRSHPTSTKMNH